ncbi:MAG: Lpg1974 family pore-forming outer membrane protein [Chlamydiota bacterium]
MCPPTICAYNAPARIDTRCSWDVWADASFIYWQPIEENLELGILNSTALPTVEGVQGGFINMKNNRYKPGFKVGLGMSFDHDNWDLKAEYTWFHIKQKTQAQVTEIPGNILSRRGTPDGQGFAPDLYNIANGKWKLGMDLVDLNLGRWCYIGTHLTFRPFVGVRGAFITQRYNSVFINDGSVPGFGGVVDTMNVAETNHSWAVGPQMGLNTNWILGEGFRLFGNGSGDLLYTRYHKLGFKETHTRTGTPALQHIRQADVNSLRTHLDAILGFGWGSYFDNNNWYFDMAFGYEFQVFFDQNNFRQFYSTAQPAGSSNPNGNLYIHGLTATLQLDF